MSDDYRSRFYSEYISHFKKDYYATTKSKLQRTYAEYNYHLRYVLETVPKSASVLELGCGPGLLLDYLRGQGFESLDGVDISEEQVAIASELGLNVTCADVFDFLPAKSLQYDVVIAFDFVEHFSKDELLDLFEMIYRTLKAGGILVLQTPNGAGLFPGMNIYGDLTHITIFTELSLTQILQLHGFGDLRFFETGPAPISVFGSVRFLLWKIIRACLNCIRKIEADKTSALWTENLMCIGRKTDKN